MLAVDMLVLYMLSICWLAMSMFAMSSPELSLPQPPHASSLLCPAVQRNTIEKLVVLLGGSFCHTLGRQQRATHLMLPRWGPDSADGSPALHESTVKKIG
jgi:hypothetical protein